MTDSTTNLRKLIEALYLKSLSQEIAWSYDQRAGVCEANVSGGFAQVVEEADEDGDYYSYIRLLNNDRQIVETIYGGTLGHNNKPFNTGHKSYWELMRDLQAISKRNALGADQVVSAMLSGLDGERLPLSDDDIPF